MLLLLFLSDLEKKPGAQKRRMRTNRITDSGKNIYNSKEKKIIERISLFLEETTAQIRID